MGKRKPRLYTKCRLCGKVLHGRAAAKAHIRLGHAGEDQGQYDIIDPTKVVAGPTINVVKESTMPGKKDPVALIEEATKDMQKQIAGTLQNAFGAPAPAPAAPAPPAQPAAAQALSEATGQKICHGLECLKQVGDQFADAAKAMTEGRPAADESHASHDDDSAAHNTTTVEKIMDDLIGCPEGICSKIVRRKVLYHWDKLFPNMTLRRRPDGEIEVVAKDGSTPPDAKEAAAAVKEAVAAADEKPVEPVAPADATPKPPDPAPVEAKGDDKPNEKPADDKAAPNTPESPKPAEEGASDGEEEGECDPTDF